MARLDPECTLKILKLFIGNDLGNGEFNTTFVLQPVEMTPDWQIILQCFPLGLSSIWSLKILPHLHTLWPGYWLAQTKLQCAFFKSLPSISEVPKYLAELVVTSSSPSICDLMTCVPPLEKEALKQVSLFECHNLWSGLSNCAMRGRTQWPLLTLLHLSPPPPPPPLSLSSPVFTLSHIDFT